MWSFIIFFLALLAEATLSDLDPFPMLGKRNPEDYIATYHSAGAVVTSDHVGNVTSIQSVVNLPKLSMPTAHLPGQDVGACYFAALGEANIIQAGVVSRLFSNGSSSWRAVSLWNDVGWLEEGSMGVKYADLGISEGTNVGINITLIDDGTEAMATVKNEDNDRSSTWKLWSPGGNSSAESVVTQQSGQWVVYSYRTSNTEELALANFTTVTFSAARAIANGSQIALDQAYRYTMLPDGTESVTSVQIDMDNEILIDYTGFNSSS